MLSKVRTQTEGFPNITTLIRLLSSGHSIVDAMISFAKSLFHIDDIQMVSLQCESACVVRG